MPSNPPAERTTPAPRSAAAAAVLAAAALGWVACGGGRPAAPPIGAERPLGEGGPEAWDRLVESSRLEPPPSDASNRFLTGWQPRRGEAGRRLAPAGGGPARVEVTLLEARPGRALWLDLADLPGEVVRARPVRVVPGPGRPAVEIPWADPLVVPLPDDLVGERLPIDLEFPAGTEVEVLGAALRGGVAHGAIDIVEGGIRQSGPSVAERVVAPWAGSRWVGRFTPPRRPSPSQAFALVAVAGSGETRPIWAWRPTRWERWGLGDGVPRAISAPLPEGFSGPLRLRLVAEGAGPPGVWSDLGWSGGTAPAAPRPRAGVEPVAYGRTAPRLVLFLVLDALRADFVGFAGGPAGVTPVIDRLAAEGVAFLAHRSVAPNTLPSTKALFTGTVPRTAGGARLPEDGPATLAERFRAAGFRTGCFSGNPNVSPAFGTTRGFETAPPEILHPGPLSREIPFNNNARVVYDAARRWIGGLGRDESAFVYLHTIHPHNPYAPPADLAWRFTRGIPSRIDGSTRTLLDLSLRRREPEPRDVDRLRGLYAASVAYNDRELGRFLEAVTRRVPAEEVMVVVTSDHGEELGEHGGFLHGYTLYEEMLRIPLVVWAPGRFPPGRVAVPTDTVDVTATLVDLLRAWSRAPAGAPELAASTGRSLAPALARGEAPEDTPRFAAGSSLKGGIFGIRFGGDKWILAPRTGDQWGMGNGVGRRRDPEFRFDLGTDPWERRNRAGDAPSIEQRRLRQALRSWIAEGLETASATGAAGESEPDAETRARLQALGYLQ